MTRLPGKEKVRTIVMKVLGGLLVLLPSAIVWCTIQLISMPSSYASGYNAHDWVNVKNLGASATEYLGEYDDQRLLDKHIALSLAIMRGLKNDRDGKLIDQMRNEIIPFLDEKKQSEYIRKVPGSAFGDTIRALVGYVGIRPWKGESQGDGKVVVNGAFDGPGNYILIKMNKDRKESDLRMILLHEVGHAWQVHHGTSLGALWAQAAIHPPTVANYGSSSATEHQAEAIGAAIGFLAMARRKDLSLREKERLCTELEKRAPGVGLMTRVVLSHPLYYGYPGRGQMVGRLDLRPLTPPRGWKMEGANGYARFWERVGAEQSLAGMLVRQIQ